MHTQLKGDILEVDLLASITCKSANDQCNYDSAECRGLLYVPPNAELQVLSVDCNPNLPVMEEPLALPVQVQTCTGCLTDVNVNADGVQHLVKSIIQHVEAEQNRRYTLVEVLRAQQQVINGVNFVLTVKIAPALCNVDTMECMRDPKEEDIYCIVKFYQEPGYQKPKNIISNNCTKSQAFIPTFSKFESNDVNKVGPDTEGNIIHEKDASWKKSERTENDILKDVMSQIIPLDKFESTSKKYIELVQSNPVKSIESSSVHNMVDDNGQPIIVSSTFQEVLATEDQPISLGTDTAVDQAFTVNNASPSSTVLGEEGSASPINPILSTEKSIIQQKENDDIVSHSVGISEKSSATPAIYTYEPARRDKIDGLFILGMLLHIKST
ncbi:hypothetical protein HHI36_002946 [Cryptolaemus montrouzieri]|uniref:Cystatin domain-containing protein n=1 Tax=Cryptolaemus montrouzieri TaxID=559131 RepID=A0ABD2PCH1_9CUCU